METERETARRLGGWTLQPARVIIVRSRHFGWEALRAILREWPSIHVAAEVPRAEAAIRAAEEFGPDAILAAVDLRDTSIVELAHRLQEASPDSKVMVFDDTLDSELQAALPATGVRGYVLWKNVTPLVLHHSLATVLEADLVVASPAAVEEPATAPERRRQQELQSLQLTDDEWTVLQALARDLKPREIVEQEPLTRPTVDRIIARLRRKLGARTMFALGMRARDLGFGRET